MFLWWSQKFGLTGHFRFKFANAAAFPFAGKPCNMLDEPRFYHFKHTIHSSGSMRVPRVPDHPPSQPTLPIHPTNSTSPKRVKRAFATSH